MKKNKKRKEKVFKLAVLNKQIKATNVYCKIDTKYGIYW